MTARDAGASLRNLLVCGDARDVLERACGAPRRPPAVALAYLDPPFRPGEMSPELGPPEAKAAWEATLRTLLQRIRSVLAPGGSVWLHIDPPNAAACDAILADELGRGSRIAWIRWERGAPWARDHLIAYSPGARGASERRETWSRADVGDVLEARREIDRLFGTKQPFPHPKPERLLSRVIDAASAPGDLVLDAFSGSGTAAAVAHKRRRAWIAIERDRSVVERFTLPRLARVVGGTGARGITGLVHGGAAGDG